MIETLAEAFSGPAGLRNIQYVEVDAVGRVYVMGSCQREVANLYTPINPGNTLVWLLDQIELNSDFDKIYYDGTEVLMRQPVPVEISKTTIAADDTDEAVITGIPDDATVIVDGEELEDFDDDTLTLTSPMPATYSVRVECWPYLPVDMEIIAQ